MPWRQKLCLTQRLFDCSWGDGFLGDWTPVLNVLEIGVECGGLRVGGQPVCAWQQRHSSREFGHELVGWSVWATLELGVRIRCSNTIKRCVRGWCRTISTPSAPLFLVLSARKVTTAAAEQKVKVADKDDEESAKDGAGWKRGKSVQEMLGVLERSAVEPEVEFRRSAVARDRRC